MSLSDEVLRLIAQSPTLMAALCSGKALNDILDRGIASADDVALMIEGCIGMHPDLASNIALMLGDQRLTLSNTMAILNSPNISTESIIRILASGAMSATKARDVLSNLPANVAQAALYRLVDNGLYDYVLNILTLGASDETVSANTTWTTGVNRRRNLTIASGVTLTLGAGPAVIIADTVTNNGTIASGWVKGAGGAAGAAGAGAGGNGAGGIIILARSITVGTITANGAAGGNGSTVAANANGGAGGAGLFWEVSGYPAGTGGDGGGLTATYRGRGSKNAGGGGATYSYYGGNGGVASVASFGSLTDLVKELLKTACDWWLVNVVGKTPTVTKSFPMLGGSGGGGGAAQDGYGAAGGGGGGGGQVVIYGTSMIAGSVSAAAGNGGRGGAEGSYDAGGGGGGGGVIYVAYKTLFGSFTTNVAGGAEGTGDQNGYAGGAGSVLIQAI